jgi:hypothetical protein
MRSRSTAEAAGARGPRRRKSRERALLALLGFTGATAVVGGSLLVVRPDGSLLRIERSALAGTPFRDWRLPGLLLGVLVGGGGLGAAGWTASRAPFDRQLAMVYGAGLVGFEIAEWVWIGPHPLEVVFGAVGLAIVGLAATSHAPGGAALGFLLHKLGGSSAPGRDDRHSRCTPRALALFGG